MSYRRDPQNIQQLIRDLDDRIRRLESGGEANHRINQLRIGNLLIEADPRFPATPTGLKITNISTGIITLVPTP